MHYHVADGSKVATVLALVTLSVDNVSLYLRVREREVEGG